LNRPVTIASVPHTDQTGPGTERAQSDAQLHRRLMAEALKSRPLFATLAGVMFLAATVILAQMLALSRIIDGVFLQGADLAAVSSWMLTLAVAVTARALLLWAGEVLAQRGAARVKADLRRRLFGHVLRLGPAWSRREHSGELVATAVEGIEKLDDYFARYLPARLGAGIVPLTVVIGVFTVDWLSGLVLCLTAPLIPIFMVLIGRRAQQATRNQWVALQRMGAHFLDVLLGIETLKLHGRSRSQSDRIRAVSDGFRLATMDVLKVAFLSGLVLELAASISTAVVAVEVGVRLVEGLMAFQPGLFVLLLAPEFYLPFRTLGARHHAGMEGVTAADRIYAILDTAPLTSDSGHGATRAPRPPEIRFDRLSFSYPGSVHPALDDLSAVLEPSRLTALAGPSGSGKSTLVKLLLRFLELQRGDLLVAGLSLRTLDRRRHLDQVALVPQNPHLFNGTVFENLRMARPDASDEAVADALRRAGAADFVRLLPDGGNTLLGNNGARLSGGERQRLAIARAFLKDAPLIILDEPASALDPESEEAIHRALESLAADRTVLVIAHRMATLRRADRVLLLDRGRLVASGSHDELRLQSPLYAAMTGPSGEVSS
jgi:ATP-binding cassette, subfamily C, bacterial CydD